MKHKGCLALLLFFIAGCAGVSTNNARISSDIGTLNFIHNYDACDCIREKCIHVQHVIDKCLKKYPEEMSAVKIEQIDYNMRRNEAEQILLKYELGFVPDIILLNNEGKVYYKVSYYFEDSDFISALEKLFKDSEKEIKQ